MKYYFFLFTLGRHPPVPLRRMDTVYEYVESFLVNFFCSQTKRDENLT